MEKRMFRYYQAGEKTAWFPINDSDEVESVALSKGARKLTILAVSELVDDDQTDKQALSYRGPLYFDIDVKGDLASAIESGRRLVKMLLEKSVAEGDIRIFCSGSKGIHVLVNQKVFSNGRPQKRLPYIYKEMALSMFVPGLDFQVYSGGRGNSFRIAGVQRGDGKYRSPISVEELMTLTTEEYQIVCEAHRDDYTHPEWANQKSMEMEVLFESCKIKAGKAVRVAGGLADESLKKIATDAPNCLRDIADFKKISADKSFNAVAMQVGILIARSGMEESVYRPFTDRLAENSATSATSARGRREEVEAQIRYMQANKKYEFSCGGMRDLLSSRPCEGCPLESEGSAFTGMGENLGIEKRSDGYYYIGARADIRISTFTMSPLNVVIDRPQDGSAPRRAYTIMAIESNGVKVGEISFNESGWKSSANFKDEVSGLKNLAFMGGDDHIQRIKHMTYSEEEQSAGEIMQVYTAGIHSEERLGKRLYTYVEPGFSINNVRVEDTYRLKGRIICPPYFSSTTIPEKGSVSADRALAAFMQMNNPLNIAKILGWFVACHLKTHFMEMYRQFPILSAWGNAGSGKSNTIEVVANLCGLDPTSDTPVNVASPTAYAILEYAASTTTIPRVMEEYNKSKMLSKNYAMIGEVLKAAWGSETIARGNLAKRSNQSSGRTGAYVEAIKVTAPICTVSEQAPEMPALVHRSLQVMFKSSELSVGRREDYYYEAREGMDELRRIGKFLMLTALCNTRTEWIREEMAKAKELVSRKLDERPRYSRQVIWVSMRWLEQCLEKLELRESLRVLRGTLLPTLEANIAGLDEESKKAKTEIDSVMESLAVMAALSNQGQDYIKHGVHYIVTDDHIYIDAPTCHILYKKFRQQYERESAVISSVQQFVVLLRAESYYEGDQLIEEIARNRMCMKLSKAEMARRGIDVSLFEGD